MLRYIVERISDGKFLELELPITVSAAGQALSGPGRFVGVLEPDIGSLRDEAGSLLIDPYATFIHEEADGVIRGTWLVTRSEVDGPSWRVEGAGFSSYFRDRPYEGEYRGIEVDPVDVARHVVEHAQSFAAADIGVTVVGSSGIRVGTGSDDAVASAQAEVDALKIAIAAEKAELDAAKQAAKVDPTPEKRGVVAAVQETVGDLTSAKEAADERLKARKEVQAADGGAWKLLYWDTPDCFDSMQDAFRAAGVDWVEWSGWNADRTRILKEIRVYPRAGRKQAGLQFVGGVNIVETVVVEDDVSEWANAVIAIGAGEGRDALRVSLSRSDGRRRRVHVVDAKHITKKTALQDLARSELTRRSTRLRVDAIRVDTSMMFAPRGTFGVGDTILIDDELSWLGRQRLWRRVVECEWVGLDLADLVLGDANV